MSTVLLVDGDTFVYRSAFAAQKNLYSVIEDGDVLFQCNTQVEMKEWIRENISDPSSLEITKEPDIKPLRTALSILKASLADAFEATKAKDIKVFLSGKTNFRNDVAITTKYKGSRTAPHPVHYDAIREHLLDYYDAQVTDGIEADDILGIENAKLLEAGLNPVICSNDKDLLMLAGTHYNWVKKTFQEISPLDGFYNFCIQMLVGDSVDDIIGLKNVGPVGATALLKDAALPEEMVDVVTEAYKQEFGDDYEARLEENAKLLWILQEEQSYEDSVNGKEIQIWFGRKTT